MTAKVTADECIVYVIDDDAGVRDSLLSLLRSVGISAKTFGSVKEFVNSKRPEAPGCLILDVRLPGIGGLEFQSEMKEQGIFLPIVFISGHADAPMAVQAMKAGAVDFICKPFREQELLDAVRSAIRKDIEQREKAVSLSLILKRYEQLTLREREVLWLIVSGMMNKQIAHQLGLSEITVKVHRAAVMRKMEVHSLAELVRHADAVREIPKYV
jgi:FixJ family two-component response regulator